MQKIISRSWHLLILLFLLHNFQVSFSQDLKQNNKLLLVEVLPQIEQQFSVTFTYVDETLDNVYVRAFDVKKTYLSKLLQNISSQTQLVFNELTKGNYAISENPELTVCATIIDAENDDRIFGATIVVVNKSQGALSIEDGSFKLSEIKRTDSLEVRYLGYKSVGVYAKDLLDLTNCPLIKLERKYETLNEVVLTEFLTVGIQKQKDGVISMSPDDFGILPGLAEPDVLQTIQALPGVKSIDETISDINIRGGTNDQNLVLWDDIRMFQLGHFFGLISAFNPYVTNNIAVIKNGTNAQYGDGVSSVIKMETDNDVKEEFSGGGGINFIGADAYANLPIREGLSAQVSARRSATDFLRSPTYDQYFTRAFQDSKITDLTTNEDVEDIEGEETFFFYDLSAKILYDLDDKHSFRASFINIANKLTYVERAEVTGNPFDEEKESSLDQKSLAFGGNWTAKWTDRLTTTLSGYYTNYDLDALNFTLFSDQRLLQLNEVLETGTKLVATYDLQGERVYLSGGYHFSEIGVTNITDINIPSFNETRKDVLRNHAVFGEYNFSSETGDLAARLGLRANYFSNFEKLVIEPRLNVVYKFSPEITGELRAEMKSQTATQEIDLQDNFLGVEKRRWELSNDGSRPITQSKQASTEFSYNKNNWLVSLSAFYKDVTGITTSNQGFQNQNQFARFEGGYSLSGVEFLLNKKAANFSAWLGYSYNVNNYEFTDLDPGEFRNNLDVRHAVTVAATYTWQKIRFALGTNWRTGRPYTLPLPGNEINESGLINTINYDVPNGANLDDYWRTDFSANYKFNVNDRLRATVGAALLNIFDRRNTLNIYYRLDTPQSDNVQEVEQKSLGITPNVSFRLNF
ncbi:TonB-dependent receptor [Spongiivirga citrea]|uniref:TonB-dependent receptor plug domain-containing protein n=1 Tax=Spongiivirga citrea TaxID=1481457 RepID=A0A6M0CJJ8_9FLAO|nr:TonB-dependent receptor [Spongiivirga citrea]NER16154.1 TonB-dependent receptor plug domain-containing protein [Spongiivirga citrea]